MSLSEGLIGRDPKSLLGSRKGRLSVDLSISSISHIYIQDASYPCKSCAVPLVHSTLVKQFIFVYKTINKLFRSMSDKTRHCV